MRFVREEAYQPDRSLLGTPVLSASVRLWIAQMSAVAAVLWAVAVTWRALRLGFVAMEAAALLAWWGRLLAAGVVVLPLSCLLHELWHHAAAPGGLRSQRNVVLLKWGWLPVAAAHEAWVSRNRQLVIHLTPLAGMTAFSLLIAALVPPDLRFYAALFWELNVLLCAADLAVVARILRLEPHVRMCGATVREPGTRSAA